MNSPLTRQQIIRKVQDYCADIAGNGGHWSTADGKHIAALLNEDSDPVGLVRFIEENTGNYRIGYRTRDGREWFHILQQMRNQPDSGLLGHLRSA